MVRTENFQFPFIDPLIVHLAAELVPVIFVSNLPQRALKPVSVCVSFKLFHMNSGDYGDHSVLGVMTDGK